MTNTNKIGGGSLQPCKKCGQQWCNCNSMNMPYSLHETLERLYPENRWDRLKSWVDLTFITPIQIKWNEWWWCKNDKD